MKKLLFLLPLFLLSWCWSTEIRNSFYYPDALQEWTEKAWPTFNNYEWCRDYVLQQKKDGYCSLNCHDSVDWTPICEDVVRTRQPIPWFWKVFEWVTDENHTVNTINKQDFTKEVVSILNADLVPSQVVIDWIYDRLYWEYKIFDEGYIWWFISCTWGRPNYSFIQASATELIKIISEEWESLSWEKDYFNITVYWNNEVSLVCDWDKYDVMCHV